MTARPRRRGSVALAGVVAGDTLGMAGPTLTFTDKNAGAGKAVSVSGGTLTGADAANYTLTLPATAAGDILRRAIAVAAEDAAKIDGEADPVLRFTIMSGTLITGEALSGAPVRPSISSAPHHIRRHLRIPFRSKIHRRFP